MTNILLQTDVYKLGHMDQYRPDIKTVYSYLEARKGGSDITFYGLHYYLKRYLTGEDVITSDKIIEAHSVYESILGKSIADNAASKLRDLHTYFKNHNRLPLKIKAIDEGISLATKNILMSVENTDGFYWLPGFLESFLLKLWYPCSVATKSKLYHDLVSKYAKDTCDNSLHIPYSVHDFGYRGVSSEESAAVAGSSHLVYFSGTDTLVASNLAQVIYSADKTVASSVPATEHSVMCSYGKDNELLAFESMLDLYPTGIVSIVSDTYDYYNVLTQFLPKLKDRIMSREGKVVIRPDSGLQEHILLGNPDGKTEAERKGTFTLLWELVGGEINSKGYKVLDSHIGVIFGDGFYYERFERVLEGMKQLGFATSNLVIGVGGILLQNHSRDDYGFAFKATHAITEKGEEISLFKDPATDKSKKSKKGRMVLLKSDNKYKTVDQLSYEEQSNFKDDQLKLVYSNRVEDVVYTPTFASIRRNSGVWLN